MDTSPPALRMYQAQEKLLNGAGVLVRAIRPDDKQALQDGLHRLSAESVYFRFFHPKHDLTDDELAYFTEIDFALHVALVAVVREQGTDLAVGVGRYIVNQTEPVEAAEVAFAVDDAHQGLGIATLLLKHLTRIARARALAEFHANVMVENLKMMDVFAHCGLPMTSKREGAILKVRLSLSE